MKLKKFRFLLIFAFAFLCRIGSAQLFDESQVFLHYRRSLTSNFINAEVQFGNSDERNFLTIRAGVNYGSYKSFEYCPYYLAIPEPKSIHRFYNYSSYRKGLNAGIGGLHYFNSLSNLETFIPYIGIEGNWYFDRDSYAISYENISTGSQSGYSDQKKFHSLSADILAGGIYIYKNIYFSGSLILSCFLPVNSYFYLATDPYNPRSSTRLPLAGFEPALQLGMGFKM